MSYPNLFAFKNRPLISATTTSSNEPTTVIVPFRGKYLYSVANYQNFVAMTSGFGLNLSYNGSTASADTFVSNPFINTTSTSTAAVSGGFNSSTSNIATLFVNQGDVLATVATSAVPYTIMHVIQEF